MKKVLLFAALLFAGFVGIVKAAGEGPILGQAWHDYNDAAALIATRGDHGEWVYNQDLIDANGDKASGLLGKVDAEIAEAKDDEKASSVEGKNSIESLEKLVSRAKKVIEDGADSLDDKKSAE